MKINDCIVSYEPDEEGNYRAIVDADKPNECRNINTELLKSIALAIQSILK